MIDIKFKSISIEGFRSFKKKQVFIFNRNPGLYFIGGKNEIKPRLGSNAVGKSTIFDALKWCLKGETVGGVEGNVLKSWNMPKKTECKVIVTLSKNKDDFVITKTQGPNSLILECNGAKGEIVTQTDLDKLIPLDPDQFAYTLLMGQFQSSFLNLTPTPKLNLFSAIMGLDFWEHCSKLANEKSSKLDLEKNELDTKKKVAEDKSNNLSIQLTDLSNKQKSHDSTRKEQQAELTKKADSILANLSMNTNQNDELAMEMATHEQEQRKLKHTIEEVLPPKMEVITEKEIKPFDKQIATLTEQKRNLDKSLSKWKEMKDSCPYCEQIIDKAFLTAEKTKLKKELVSISKELDSVLESKKESTKKLDELIKEFLQTVKEEKEKQAIIGDLNRKLDVLEKEKSLKLQEIKHLREQALALNEQINPFESLIIDCKNNIEIVSKNLETIVSKIDTNLKTITGIQFWSKGFKELRLWVITDALEALQIESNNALAELGLPDWCLKFVIERETTKKGGLSKGLYVLVNSPDIPPDSYVPFEIWCGGETQRLKLATIIGLKDLIQNYKGINFNIMNWDEPSTYLSDEGIDDLIKYLDYYSKENKQSIYWIDQRYLQSPEFAGIITVKNTKEGSVIDEI